MIIRLTPKNCFILFLGKLVTPGFNLSMIFIAFERDLQLTGVNIFLC